MNLTYLFILLLALILSHVCLAQTIADEHRPDKRSFHLPPNNGDLVSRKIDQTEYVYSPHYPPSVRLDAPATVTVHELAHRIPGRAAREYSRAAEAERKGDDSSAAEHYKKAIDSDPEYCAAINDLGTLYLRSDKVDLAMEQFSKTISIDPHAPAPYYNLTLAYLQQDRLAEAEQTARRFVALDRVGKRGLLILGTALVLQHKFTAEAERLLKIAAGEYVQAQLWLGLGMVAKGQLVNAKEPLQKYLASGEKVGSELAASMLKRIEAAGESK